MSRNVRGLASSLDDSDVSDKPSVVSSLASRFDSPPPASDAPPVITEKLSGLASRFGATIADDPAPQKPKPVKKKTEPVVKQQVVEEKPDFGAITKRFAEGVQTKQKKEEEEDEGGMFERAHSAFKKMEEGAKKPVEGKVSAFARGFDKGEMGKKKGTAKEDAKNAKESGNGNVVEEKPQSVGNIASRFEGVSLAEKQKEPAQGETMNRMESAAKLFAEKEQKEEEQEEVGSKFRDAAKVFGGN